MTCERCGLCCMKCGTSFWIHGTLNCDGKPFDDHILLNRLARGREQLNDGLPCDLPGIPGNCGRLFFWEKRVDWRRGGCRILIMQKWITDISIVPARSCTHSVLHFCRAPGLFSLHGGDMTHINDIVKPTDSILIVPAPAGYIVMKAPTSDDHEPEMFAALSSAGDVLLFLIDLYGVGVPVSDKSIEALQEAAYDSMYDVGRVETGVRKALPVPESPETPAEPPEPGALPLAIVKPTKTSDKIVIAKPVRKPLQIAQADRSPRKTTAKPTHDGAGRRIALKGTSNNVLQENTHKIEDIKKVNIEKAKARGVEPARLPIGFMCDDCGETFEKCPQECPKCGGGAFEELS